MPASQVKALPKTDRSFKAWLHALPAGTRLNAMHYPQCVIGRYAKTLNVNPYDLLNQRPWAYQYETQLLNATRELAPDTRTITAAKFRKWLGTWKPKAA